MNPSMSICERCQQWANWLKSKTCRLLESDRLGVSRERCEEHAATGQRFFPPLHLLRSRNVFGFYNFNDHCNALQCPHCVWHVCSCASPHVCAMVRAHAIWGPCYSNIDVVLTSKRRNSTFSWVWAFELFWYLMLELSIALVSLVLYIFHPKNHLWLDNCCCRQLEWFFCALNEYVELA